MFWRLVVVVGLGLGACETSNEGSRARWADPCDLTGDPTDNPCSDGLQCVHVGDGPEVGRCVQGCGAEPEAACPTGYLCTGIGSSCSGCFDAITYCEPE